MPTDWINQQESEGAGTTWQSITTAWQDETRTWESIGATGWTNQAESTSPSWTNLNES